MQAPAIAIHSGLAIPTAEPMQALQFLQLTHAGPASSTTEPMQALQFLQLNPCRPCNSYSQPPTAEPPDGLGISLSCNACPEECKFC